MKRHMITTALVLLSTLSLHAEQTEFAVEIDPATYAFEGYSVHLKMTPAQLPQLQLGIGVYAMDFPDIFVDMHSKNKDKGWDVRLDRGIGFFADYYFDDSQEGWFAGAQLARQRYEIGLHGEQSSYDVTLIMAHGGYRYNINDHWYLKAWGGVGYAKKTSGSNVVAGEVYDVPDVVPFGALHVGYRF